MHQPALRQKFQAAPARAALNQTIKQGEGKPSGRLFHGAETLREMGTSRATLGGRRSAERVLTRLRDPIRRSIVTSLPTGTRRSAAQPNERGGPRALSHLARQIATRSPSPYVGLGSRFHGGKSTGPKTQAGRARIAEAQRLRWLAYRERVRAVRNGDETGSER